MKEFRGSVLRFALGCVLSATLTLGLFSLGWWARGEQPNHCPCPKPSHQHSTHRVAP